MNFYFCVFVEIFSIFSRKLWLMSNIQFLIFAIQTLNGHLRLNVGRDLYAKPTSAYKERKLSPTAKS